jgi:hypothetical protein
MHDQPDAAITTEQRSWGDAVQAHRRMCVLTCKSAPSGCAVVVVFGALTWCRPCKGMQRPVQVGVSRSSGPAAWPHEVILAALRL